MSIFTSFFNLIKPTKQDGVKVSDFNANMDTIDTEMHRPPLTVNGTLPNEVTRDIHLESVPLADNLSSDDAQFNRGTFIERTSGGSASIEDGTASLSTIKGNMVKTGYVPEALNMVVNAVPRVAPAAITATLDAETFEAYVVEAGEYTLTYDTEWNESPALYGVTVTNTPVSGDSIVITWDGENAPEMTVNAVVRPAPAPITATIDRATFVSYVTASGTVTLSYTTAWSVNPSLYGITVYNTPVSGDSIVVTYVKENRGTITPVSISSFNSTGWNLYDNTTGYAKVVKYSNDYGYAIGGSYGLVRFATTPTGDASAVDVQDGYFNVPSDGYIIVTGGDATTYIFATWTDWVEGYEGEFESYTVDTIDLSGIMVNFPAGLLAVGDVRDEINFNLQKAISRIMRLEYTDANLEAVIESGVLYDTDTNYIYAVRQSPVETAFSVDGEYTVSDHGIEYYDATTTTPPITESLYGQNLKDKLRTDVVTISAQTLSAAQQAQVAANLGIERSTLRDVPFAVGVSDWSSSGGQYVANFTTAYVTTGSKVIMTYDSSLRSYAQADINATIKTGGGGMTFTTATIPTGTITGNLYVFNNADNRIPTLIENTVTPIANGGTGQSSLAGAKQALGITDVEGKIASKSSMVDTANGVWRFGNVCFITCIASTWYNTEAWGVIHKSSTSGAEWNVPAGYRPVANVEIYETLNGKRIVIDKTTGAVQCAADISGGANLRFSGCWITNDTMPT